MATNPITIIWASTTTNTVTFSSSEIGNGIVYEGGIVSNQLNGVAQFITTAIRHTQTTGELYDPSQTYNPSQYCSQLVSTNGIVKISFFQNASNGNLTGEAPLTGTTASNQNDVLVLNDDSNLTPSSDWSKVLVDNKLIKSTTTSANQMYQLVNLANQTFGSMKIKTYDTSGNMHCVFDLDIYRMMGEIQFNIKNVLYCSTIKMSSTTYASYANIFFPGFGLMLTQNGLFFAVTNNALCTTIEVEYSNMNFTPTLQQTTLPTPNASTAKIYAIRNGGGTFIQDLGVIKSNYRNTGNNPLEETLQFYLFSNGFVQWTSAMTLDSNYFHQWSNGNFGNLNIDVSDRVFRNVGINATQTLGTLLEDAIRNITGGWQTSKRNSRLVYGGVEACPIQNYGSNLPNGKAIAYGIFKGTDGNFNGTSSDIVNSDYNLGFTLDVSRQVPTASENRMKSLTVIPVVQAF